MRFKILIVVKKQNLLIRRTYMHQENCNLKTDKPRGKQNLSNILENAQIERENANCGNSRGQRKKQKQRNLILVQALKIKLSLLRPAKLWAK